MERDAAPGRFAALMLLAMLLLVTGASASSSATTIIYGRILPKNPITVDFAGNPLSGCAPLRVRFTDLSVSSPPAGKIVYWEWTFYRNGTTIPIGRISGTGWSSRNPSYTFRCPGIYDVRLKVCDRTDCSGYNNSLKKTAYICAWGPEYSAMISAMRNQVTATGLDRLPKKWFFDPADLLTQLDQAQAELRKPGWSAGRIAQYLNRFHGDLRYIQFLYRLDATQKTAVKDLMGDAHEITGSLSSCSGCPAPPVTCGSPGCG